MKKSQSSSFFRGDPVNIQLLNTRVMSTSDVLGSRLIYPYDMQQVGLGIGIFLLHRTCVTHLLYM